VPAAEPIAVETAAPVPVATPKPATLEPKQEAATAAEKPKAPGTEPATPAAPAPAPPQTSPSPAPAAGAPSALTPEPPATPAATPPAAAATPPAAAPTPSPIPPAPAPAPTPPVPAAKPRPRKAAVSTAESAPVVTAQGELVLLIRPWARVEVDGREVGVTPLNEPLMLPAGEHTVRLVNPELNKDLTRTVHITPSGREVLKELLDE